MKTFGQVKTLIVNKSNEYGLSFLYRDKVTFMVETDFDVVNKLLSLNDKAHQWEHVIDVTVGAMKLAEIEEAKLGFRLRHDIIIASALWHDTAGGLNRDRHHELGGKMFQLYTMFNNFDIEDVEWVKEVILTHRKSCGHDPETTEAMCVAVADKGQPAKSHEDLLLRAVQFNAEKHGRTDPTLSDLAHSINHVHDITKKVFSDNPVWVKWREQEGFKEWMELRDSLPSREDLDTLNEDDLSASLSAALKSSGGWKELIKTWKDLAYKI